MNQAITDTQPGAVLHDFRVVLDFVGSGGIETGGKYNLLPLKFIGELDARLSRPLKLKLKRPQLRSHPYLLGLNLLLRASGLTVVDGIGEKARLVIDPAMLVQWNALNPTEQYFNLLEAWLRFGRGEMVGESRGRGDGLLFNCWTIWRSVAKIHRSLRTAQPKYVHVIGGSRDLYQLALVDLFGLVAVDHRRQSAGTWHPSGVKHTPFGDAVLSLLDSRVNVMRDGGPLQGADDDRDEEEPPADAFGLWQPVFQPYFPEWRHNLELPELEPREGTFVFRASLDRDIWRLIAMPADATTADLVDWILDCFNFDDDHLYELSYRDRMGVMRKISGSPFDGGYVDDEDGEPIPLGELPIEPGQSMELLYDFGDSWNFSIKLEGIEPPSPKARGKARRPRILKKHGRAPAQYASADDW